MSVIDSVIPYAGGSLFGGGLLLYGLRMYFAADQARQKQTNETRDQLDKSHAREEELQKHIGTLQTEISNLHQQINELKTATAIATAHEQGLRIELEYAERQVKRLEKELEEADEELRTLRADKVQLQQALTEARGGK